MAVRLKLVNTHQLVPVSHCNVLPARGVHMLQWQIQIWQVQPTLALQVTIALLGLFQSRRLTTFVQLVTIVPQVVVLQSLVLQVLTEVLLMELLHLTAHHVQLVIIVLTMVQQLIQFVTKGGTAKRALYSEKHRQLHTTQWTACPSIVQLAISVHRDSKLHVLEITKIKLVRVLVKHVQLVFNAQQLN